MLPATPNHRVRFEAGASQDLQGPGLGLGVVNVQFEEPAAAKEKKTKNCVRDRATGKKDREVSAGQQSLWNSLMKGRLRETTSLNGYTEKECL